MNSEDAKLISMLAAFRKGSNFGPDFTDETTQKFWLSRLSGIAFFEIRKALGKLSGEREFPTANQVLNSAKGFGSHDAQQAFDWVWSHLDGYRAPKNLPILTARTIDELGGWFTISRDWRDFSRESHQRAFI